MMSLIANELQELTGRKTNAVWIQWLTANRWRFAVRADGNPVVSIAEMVRRANGSDDPVCLG